MIDTPEERVATDRNHASLIMPLRTSGSRAPLICISPGSPGVRNLSDALADDQPVYEFYWSQLHDGSNFPTVEELAAAFLQDLQRVQTHGPYQLCGYSSAGFIAYEMARLLLDQGQNVSVLILLDTWHPDFSRNLPAGERVRYRIIRRMDAFRKFSRLLMSDPFGDFAAETFQAAQRRIKLGLWRIVRSIFKSAHSSVPRGLAAVESFVTLGAYSPKPYADRVVLIRPKDVYERIFTDTTMGWNACVGKGVEVSFLPVNHGMLMHHPDVGVLASEISRHLANERNS